MTINLNGDGKPFEVFLSVGKAGSDIAAMSEALGRLMSLTLRIASPTPPDERLAQIAEQMRGIGGRCPIGFGGNRVRSLPDGIAKIIGESANDEGEGEGNVPSDCEGKGSSMVDLCPECGAVSLRYEEGCRHCSICGFSEC
jgi:ribonucleoside-diphosphate reductase alpha chain